MTDTERAADRRAPPAAGTESPSDLPGLAARYGVEYLAAVDEAILDPSLVDSLPVEWARANLMLPVRIGGDLCVLTSDPSRVSGQEYLALLLGAPLRPVLAPREAVLRSIEQCYYRRENSAEAFIEELPSEVRAAAERGGAADDLLRVAEKAPVTQLVNLILLEAVKQRASDIHFEPFEDRLRVRYRIDGVLYERASPPKQIEEPLVSRLKVMAHMDIAEKRLPQDGMTRVRVGEREIDIRVATIPVAEGERVVLRLLDRGSALLPLAALGMNAAVLAAFEALLRESNGLIAVCGPTGSGKTTTLYAALGRLDESRRNILTIEDPIEYRLPNIGQIQVKPKIGLTFATGLRHILRQDPDIVLVGETRDVETAEIALRAALTGHLVFTTLHTNDAPGAALRLIDMGVEPYLLAACLRGALAQRLVRTLCQACRRPVTLAAGDVASLGPAGAGLIGRTAWEAAGCPACLEGYRGRTGLFELMLIDAGMQETIRGGKIGVGDLRARAEERGMRGLLADGIERVLAGATTVAEVVTVASGAAAGPARRGEREHADL
ncbi:MAG: type II/IV secretion system protein [Lentisphaerae bacterium]|nr:type II/IV secretion system protein [Lentisphaerota bacterium]